MSDVKSDNYLFDELPFGAICPTCNYCPVTFYDTHNDKKGGMYKCPDCGRDTVWKIGKALSIEEVLQKIGVRTSGEKK